MEKKAHKEQFQRINRGYNTVFRHGRLSVGLVVPIENYTHTAEPEMVRHIDRIQLAEKLGFSAVWLRDIPFNVPSFGDVGQMFDPFVYLGLLAGQTSQIALGVASIILPLRHPAHVAKSAATVDALSDGRLVLGVASGDRPQEFPALNFPFNSRGEKFRDSFEYIRNMSHKQPIFENSFGQVNTGMDMLPKPTANRLPLLITGGSQQSMDWIAQNGDGWMIYPRNVGQQAQVITDYQTRVEAAGRPIQPILQPLYIDLVEDSDATPQPIHLGFRSGTKALLSYMKSLQEIGVNHLALNLRFNSADIESTMKRLADEILPMFAE
ncbi:MAG: LLM class oxidoreductase [Chloroflexota bacterium]